MSYEDKLNSSEIRGASISAVIVNFLFVLSPVGLTILLGEAVSNRVKDPVQRATTAITAMSALAQSTYLSGIIIPLIALGIPLSQQQLDQEVHCLMLLLFSQLKIIYTIY